MESGDDSRPVAEVGDAGEEEVSSACKEIEGHCGE
jgi:hypothetical protein